MFGKLKRYFADPYWALGCDLIQKHPNWMSDKFYIRTLWRMIMGYKLDLKHPRTFNEKLQWLKLYDRNPLYTTLVDKYRVKQWVADKIGEEYVIPTLAVWERAEDVDISKLPNQFVLKCNHDSGSVVICKDKKTFDLNAAKDKLRNALKHNFYLEAREWPYKNVKPCIFAEKFMEDGTGEELRDYKFWCFNGVPKIVYCSVKNDNIWENYYDVNFTPLDINHGFPRAKQEIEKPDTFEDMKSIIGKFALQMPFVRVDFYEIRGRVYFGEFTCYDFAGLKQFQDIEQDNMLGDMIKLPIDKK
jgi:hypothetical protein